MCEDSDYMADHDHFCGSTEDASPQRDHGEHGLFLPGIRLIPILPLLIYRHLAHHPQHEEREGTNEQENG